MEQAFEDKEHKDACALRISDAIPALFRMDGFVSEVTESWPRAYSYYSGSHWLAWAERWLPRPDQRPKTNDYSVSIGMQTAIPPGCTILTPRVKKCLNHPL